MPDTFVVCAAGAIEEVFPQRIAWRGVRAAVLDQIHACAAQRDCEAR